MVLSILLTIFFLTCVHSKGLQEEFLWTRINFAWPTTGSGPGENQPIIFPGRTDRHKSNNAVTGNRDSQNNYQYENNIPMGANRWKNKLFITVPRRRNGVPSTLNYVWMNDTKRHNVPLIPYPDWESNRLRSANNNNNNNNKLNLVSVYRTAVDVCDRIWMVDTGLIEIPGNATRIQPASIIIIDLHTNQLIRKYEFKSDDVKPASTLANLIIDVSKSDCNNAFAYIPDLSGYGLIVYSFEENDSWRVSHNYFYLESLAGEFHIGGFDFQWNDGVFSVSLTNPDSNGNKIAYFHSMAGTHIYSVSTRILKNRELATRSYHGNDFKVEIDRGMGSQTSASDLHRPTGVLFLALVNQNALGCWNTHKTPILSNFDVVYKNDQKFIYPSDIKIQHDDVIVLTNSMPIFLYGRLNYDEVNFRVWITDVTRAISETRCL